MDSSKQKKPTSYLDIIAQSGRLKYPVSKIISIIQNRHPTLDLKKIEQNLSIPGTKEHSAYNNGRATGDFELDNALYNTACSGDTDAQEMIRQTRKDQEINKALRDKFGLGDCGDLPDE